MRASDPKYYETLWDTLIELSSAEWQGRIDHAAQRIARHRPRYEAVASLTGVPWPVIGAIHQMENPSLDACLMNGQPWNRKTTIAPIGHGPWDSWEDAAVAALEYDGLAGQSGWSVAATAMRFERYNGGTKWRTRGYAKRGVNSPYLWSGCQHGLHVGKYVGERPGKKAHYDPDAVSGQVGAMVILKRLESMGIYRPGEALPARAWPRPIRVRTTQPDGRADAQEIEAVKALQALLNSRFGATLVLDGWYGPMTAVAHDRAIPPSTTTDAVAILKRRYGQEEQP